MKTNPLTSKLRDFYASISKHRLAVAIIALLLFFLLISLVACKSPATLTNDTQHRTRDSNYHATIHRIETHDTIIIGPYPKTLPAPPLKGGNPKSPFKGDLEGLVRVRRRPRLLYYWGRGRLACGILPGYVPTSRG